jgi:hypothetical protein
MYYKWKRQYDAYGESAFENRHYRTTQKLKD